MVVERKVIIENNMVSKSNAITNKELLEVLVDTAGKHSNSIGNGFDEFAAQGKAWVLLVWKVKILKRPKLNDEISIKTWVQKDTGIFSVREFNVFDENNECIIKASSKWCIMNLESRRPMRFEDELINAYEPEDMVVFEEGFDKIKIPTEFLNETKYIVKEDDVDNIKHFHNSNYLKAAYTAIENYNADVRESDDFSMEFKKEILLDECIDVCYSREDASDIVVLKTNEKVNAVIKLS